MITSIEEFKKLDSNSQRYFLLLLMIKLDNKDDSNKNKYSNFEFMEDANKNKELLENIIKDIFQSYKDITFEDFKNLDHIKQRYFLYKILKSSNICKEKILEDFVENITIEEYKKLHYDRKRYFIFELMKYPTKNIELIQLVLEDIIGSYRFILIDKIIEGKIDEIIEWLQNQKFYYMNYKHAISYYFSNKRYDMIEFFINKFNGISTNVWANSLIECSRVGNLQEFKYLIELIPKIYIEKEKYYNDFYEDEKEKYLRLFAIEGIHCFFKDEDTDEYIINRVKDIAYKESLSIGKDNIKLYIKVNNLIN